MPHRVQWFRFYSIILLLCRVVPWYNMTSLPQSLYGLWFSLPWLFMWLLEMDFFGTQRTVIRIFHSMNLHVALSVVCGLWCLLITFNIFIWLLRIICSLGTFSMFYFMIRFSHFLLSFRYLYFINLTAIIKMECLKSLLGYCFSHICCVNPFQKILFCCADHKWK